MNSPLNAPLDVIPGNTGFSLCGVPQNGTHRLKPELLKLQKFNGVTSSVFYHLRKNLEMPQKDPNVFYHLETISPVTTCVFYHLLKKGGEGGIPSQVATLGSHDSPTSNSFNISNLRHFWVSPPHVSPLFSYACRKQWWVGGRVWHDPHAKGDVWTSPASLPTVRQRAFPLPGSGPQGGF
jgi:hypothetical protein